MMVTITYRHYSVNIQQWKLLDRVVRLLGWGERNFVLVGEVCTEPSIRQGMTVAVYCETFYDSWRYV